MFNWQFDYSSREGCVGCQQNGMEQDKSKPINIGVFRDSAVWPADRVEFARWNKVLLGQPNKAGTTGERIGRGL
jgi:hypothetical protein